MLGRGLAANPGLVNQLRGQSGVTAKQLEEFHGELFAETAARLGNPRSTMFRMKEIWSYMILMFDRREKYQILNTPCAQLGLDMKLPPNIVPRPYTRLAFQGWYYACDHGMGDAYNERMYRAYFIDELDIGDIDEIFNIFKRN